MKVRFIWLTAARRTHSREIQGHPSTKSREGLLSLRFMIRQEDESRTRASPGTGTTVTPVSPKMGPFSHVFGFRVASSLSGCKHECGESPWHIVSAPWALCWVHHSLAVSRAGFCCALFSFSHAPRNSGNIFEVSIPRHWLHSLG